MLLADALREAVRLKLVYTLAPGPLTEAASASTALLSMCVWSRVFASWDICASLLSLARSKHARVAGSSAAAVPASMTVPAAAVQRWEALRARARSRNCPRLCGSDASCAATKAACRSCASSVACVAEWMPCES